VYTHRIIFFASSRPEFTIKFLTTLLGAPATPVLHPIYRKIVRNKKSEDTSAAMI
jgi:hypothetical protein